MGNGVYAFDMSAIWDRLQGLDRSDIVDSCLAKLCNRIGKDRDSSDMISRLHDLSHPRAQNGISDSLVRTVRSTHKEISLQEEGIKHKPSETCPDRLRIGPSMTIGTRMNQARSLCYYRTCTLSGHYVATERLSRSVARSDRAFVPLGCYVATELEPKLGRYVATERSFRSVAT
ncbi:hypothetical protein F2Q69_00010978 [Brassica cretica]|uniref:Uncharacterized protein n=1 Tax=Brassica cretica TaxID=69181 RepID=A0A8S9QVB0_BRACR|nr:hypothetical protein F2Q69_00010978 [Brassica cretica]